MTWAPSCSPPSSEMQKDLGPGHPPRRRQEAPCPEGGRPGVGRGFQARCSSSGLARVPFVAATRGHLAGGRIGSGPVPSPPHWGAGSLLCPGRPGQPRVKACSGHCPPTGAGFPGSVPLTRSSVSPEPDPSGSGRGGEASRAGQERKQAAPLKAAWLGRGRGTERGGGERQLLPFLWPVIRLIFPRRLLASTLPSGNIRSWGGDTPGEAVPGGAASPGAGGEGETPPSKACIVPA